MSAEFNTEGELEKLNGEPTSSNNNSVDDLEVLEPVSRDTQLLDSDLSADIENLEVIDLEPFEDDSRVIIDDRNE